jgi:hypothetical protein
LASGRNEHGEPLQGDGFGGVSRLKQVGVRWDSKCATSKTAGDDHFPSPPGRSRSSALSIGTAVMVRCTDCR